MSIKIDWEAVGEEAVIAAQEAIRQSESEAHKAKVKDFQEERRLQRLAQRIKREVLTDEERYKKAVFDTIRAEKQNRITLQEKNRQLERLTRSHLKVDEAVKRRLQSEAQLSARAKQLVGEEETAAQQRIRISHEAIELERRGKITKDQMLAVLREQKFLHEGGAAAQERANAAQERANRLAAQHASPGAQYAARIAQLRADRDESTMSPEVYRAEVTRIKREMFGPGKSAEREAAELTKLNEVHAKALTNQEKYQQILRQNETGAQRYARRIGELKEVFRNSSMTAREYGQEVAKIRHEMKGGAEAEREAAEAAKQRQAAAARIVEKNLSPMQRYKRDLREVIRLEKSGELTTEQRRRATAALRRELQGAATAGNQAFGQRMRAQLGGYLSVAAGIGVAVQNIRAGIEASNQAAGRAASQQTTAADARRLLKLNLLGVTDAERERTLAFADSLSGELGLPQVLVDTTLRNAVSAASTPARARAFTRASLTSLRTAQGADAFTGGILDIANAMGVDDPDIAKGFVFTGLQRSRITDQQKFTANAPRVVTTGASAGIDPAVMTAVFNAITVAAADKDGEVSRTATINLIERMPKFFTDEVRKRYGITKGESDTQAEMLQLLLNDPKLGKEFTDTVGFRAAGIGGVRGLLEQLNPEALKVYQLTLRDLRDRQALRRRGQRGDTVLNTGRFERTAEQNRRTRALGERSAFGVDPLLTEENEARFADFIYQLRREQGIRGTANLPANYRSRHSLAPTIASTLTPSALVNPRGAVGQEMFMRMGPEVSVREQVDFLADELRGIDNYREVFGGAVSGPQIEAARAQLDVLERIATATETQAERPATPPDRPE